HGADSDVHEGDDHGAEHGHSDHGHEHHSDQPHVHDHHDHSGGEIDDSHGAEFHEGTQQRPRRRPRSYKIQEVIKRRQIILVQVVKEERGNKGAALTTYLSLAGRYTVLMPNTARGGGISRKITNPQDRRRLKAIAQELEVPEGMGLIIRTAGAARTKQEIKRDFEYLLRLWESVRDLTLQSTAPSLVYEEGDLIKRSIRDLYNKDVEEIVVAGEAGHQEAADFMKMLMPSHAKNVVDYRDPTPLFTRYGVERQLNAMFQPQVTLRSGGYIVINQTEALVAIDVNSGKSTREFSIEETALATNLEAADEIARQLKLRDLAGLIVIDFIDMEEKRNNRAVERRLKDALRFDRARIQLGRISHFGLMEMSRQRLRTGVLEGSTSQCPHCQGTGIIRSTESIALAVLRGLEDAITAGATGPLTATTTPAVALYILNSKRAYVTDMEHRHGYSVTVLGSDRVQGANFTIERGGPSVPVRRVERAAVNMDWG
ncbi:ribonuclease E/G, partial [Frankia sp. AgW1.1]|uniref:Rne/Rng family ribonuclease n=1 Tax=Frankia sp. AgW1.1 TaxID=1836971 RepID=UPI0019329204